MWARPDAKYRPELWDSKPFAWCRSGPVVHEALSSHPEELQRAAARTEHASRGKTSTKSLAYSLICTATHNASLEVLFASRLRNVFPLLGGITPHRVGIALASANNCSPHIAMSVVRTFSSGWCMLHRMHERVRLPCILGCHCETDTLSHYMNCPVLWSLVTHALGDPLPHEVLARLGTHAGLMTRRPRHLLRDSHLPFSLDLSHGGGFDCR